MKCPFSDADLSVTHSASIDHSAIWSQFSPTVQTLVIQDFFDHDVDAQSMLSRMSTQIFAPNTVKFCIQILFNPIRLDYSALSDSPITRLHA